jgi:hypothetical protein
VGAVQRCGRTALVGAEVVVAARDVRGCEIGDDVQLVEARGNRARLERGDVGRCGARAGIDRHHRPVAAERHHHRGRRPRRGARGGVADALLGEHRADELPPDVVAERRRDRRVQAEPRGADGGDRASARRAHELGGEPLLAERRQRLQADEREVEKDRGGDDEVGHGRSRISGPDVMRRARGSHRR